MADAKIINYGQPIGAGTTVIPDNQAVALDIESTDGKEFVRVISTDSGERVVLGEGTGVAGEGIPVVIGPGDAGANEFTVGNGSGQEIEFDIGGTNIIKSQAATNFQIGTHAAHTLELITANTPQLHISATGLITTGGETTSLGRSRGSLHILTGPDDSGGTTESGCDDLILERGAGPGFVMLMSNTVNQSCSIGWRRGTNNIFFTQAVHDPSGYHHFKIRGMRANSNDTIHLQPSTVTGDLPAMLLASGNAPMCTIRGYFDKALSDSTSVITDGSTGTNRYVASTAHNLVVGSTVKIDSANYTVATVTDADNFILDSDHGSTGDKGQAFTDPSFLKILTGDGATALEFTNRRILAIADGSSNISIGTSATGDALTAGASNVFVGKDSGTGVTTGSDNTAVGKDALLGCTTNFSNTAIGSEALTAASIGNYNVAVGAKAMGDDYTGASSVGIGWGCLSDGGTCTNSVAVGYKAGFNATGNDFTALGYQAGLAHTSGTGCVYVGKGANTSSATSANQIAIGADVTTDGANKIRLGNSSISACNIQVDWTVDSDERIKENIQGANAGLSFINALRPVSFTRKHPAEWPTEIREKRYSQGDVMSDEDGNDLVVSTPTFDVESGQAIKDEFDNTRRVDGLIAQEVKAAIESLGVSFSGIDEAVNGKLGIQYATLVVPLIKSVQELTARIEELENGE